MTETPEKILFNFRQHNFTKVTGTIFQQSLTRLLNSHWHDCLTVVAQLIQQHCETLSQCRGWHCHNVVAWSKMKAGATSISNNGKMSLSDVATTLSQRHHNIKHLVSRPFYYRQSWFLSCHQNVRELQKYLSSKSSLWQARHILINSWLYLLLECEQDKVARIDGKETMQGLGRGKKHIQHNIVDLFPDIPTAPVFTVNGRKTNTHKSIKWH